MATAFPADSGDLARLGPRLREARRAHQMSQEALAAPEFSKSYISAIERGRARPSLRALEVLARRLGLSVSDLLAPGDPDAGAGRHDATSALADLLDEAEHALNDRRPTAALLHLQAAASGITALPSPAGHPVRFRWHFLRGLACRRLGRAAEARAALTDALGVAEQMDDPEAAARAHLWLGALDAAEGRADRALEHHELGRQQLESGAVPEMLLRLQIVEHLAQDLAALNVPARAQAVYQETIELLERVENPARYAAHYWERRQALQAAGLADEARRCAALALSAQEVAAGLSLAARTCLRLARLRIAHQELADAEHLLARADILLGRVDEPLSHSALLSLYAELAVQRGQVDQAAVAVEQALKLSGAAYGAAGEAADALARAQAAEAYAEALGCSGAVAEQQGHREAADAAFHQALALAQGAGLADLRAALALRYADLLMARGALAQAAQYYQAAVSRRLPAMPHREHPTAPSHTNGR